MSTATKEIVYENLQGVNQPYFEAFENRFKSMLKSGWYILGEEVVQFERVFADYHHISEAVGVASGLDALILSLMALELPPDSEVIVAANAYVACILSILKANCRPVLIEPNPVYGNIDVTEIERHITSKTRAIMPVHLYGNVCDMDAITGLAELYQLHIIEDCAQAHGAKWRDQKVGTFSTMSAFSFYPTKNLGALGDAGAILTNDRQLAKKLRALRNYGSEVKYYNEYVGINSRLDEIQAGFLSIKLPHLDKINSHKRELAKIYDAHLDQRFTRLKNDKHSQSVYHIYPIFHSKRDALKAHLKENGIETQIHYPIPPHQQKALKPLFEGKPYPITERLHKTTLSLPISPVHSAEDIHKVCEIMNRFI